MPMSGEMIRTFNYIDDISATLRRVLVSIAMMSPEERKELAAYMRKAQPNYVGILEKLERGEQLERWDG